MRMLTLYSGGVPNTADTLYIYDTSVSGYRYQVGLYIGSGQEITPDKYQISNNVLTIADDAHFYETSYIIEYDTADTNYIRCYFVQNKIIRSGAIFFSLAVDMFGTYISRMTYNLFTCERSNANLTTTHIEGGNVYPFARTITPFKSATFSKWSASLVVIMYVTMKQVDPFSQPIINTFPLSFDLSDLQTAIDEAYSNTYTTNKTLAFILTEVLGGVTSLEREMWQAQTYQISVNKMYLLPKEFINYTISYFEETMTLKAQTNFIQNPLEIPCRLMQPQSKALSLPFPNRHLGDKNYVGTILNNVEIDNFSSNLSLQVVTALSKNDLNVELYFSNAQIDLTSSFAWTITNNNLQADSLNRMTNFIGLLASGATAVGGVASGNPLASVGGGASFVSSLTSTLNHRNQKPPKTSANVSGDIAYYYNQNTNQALSYPIVMLSYSTTEETALEVNINGAPCAEYTRNIYDIINSSLIFANEYVNYRFIRGYFTDIKGIPTTAVSEIQSAFNSGIRVFKA